MMHVQVGDVTVVIQGDSLLLLKGDIKSNEILADVKVSRKQGEAWREVVKAMEKGE